MYCTVCALALDKKSICSYGDGITFLSHEVWPVLVCYAGNKVGGGLVGAEFMDYHHTSDVGPLCPDLQ